MWLLLAAECPLPLFCLIGDSSSVCSVSFVSPLHTLPCAHAETGTVWVCGKGAKGELGLAERPTESVVLPRSLQSSNRGCLVGCPPVVSVTRSDSALLHGCGGRGTHHARHAIVLSLHSTPRPAFLCHMDPQPPSAPTLGRVRAVAAGQSHSLFVDFEDQLWACGDNKLGCVGLGTFVNQFYPVPVGGLLAGQGIEKVAAGHSHTVALTSELAL